MHQQSKFKLKGVFTIALILLVCAMVFSYFTQTQAVEGVANDFLVKQYPNEFPHITNVDMKGLDGWRVRFRLSGERRGNIMVDSKQKVLGLPLFGSAADLYIVKWGLVDLNSDYSDL